MDPNLDIAEWMTAYFLRIPFNDRKSLNPPLLSAVILNRWWRIDYETASTRPVARWADVIEWNQLTKTANLCWFGRTGRVLAMDHNANLLRPIAKTL
jgi:hypothetical protein